MSYKFGKMKLAYILFLICLCTCLPVSSAADEFLSGSELAAITAGSVGLHFLGSHVREFDTTRSPLIGGPILFDLSLQRFLGGDCSAEKSNFLDNTFGSAATPIVAAVAMLAADLTWPMAEDKGKLAGQNLFLYGAGLLTTKGITDITKGLVARPRPLPCLEPEIAGLRNDINFVYDHNSFFSGHTSAAFFSMTFLNKRTRAIMRNELTPGKYNDWNWAPPAILFSWASFVGWTRIHAYKHFPTDIMAGALAGILVAELFYSLNDFNPGNNAAQSTGTRQIFSIRLTF